MIKNLKKLAVLGVSAAALSIAAASADPLPVQNLLFNSYSGTGVDVPKNLFSLVNPTGWTGGTGLISIDAPGTATLGGNSFPGDNAYPVYGPFPDSPSGGNFIQADGNPTFETSFNQTITGLTPGQAYTLSFWQAAGQQQGFSGPTTEQWKVFFGSGTFSVDCSTNPCTTSTTGSMQEVDSLLMNTPSQGVTPWNEVFMTFTADATSDVLSFLAWGDNGNTTNLPPTVFLAGVNSPAVPEPATLSIFGAGIVGAVIRRRMKRKASA